jgi:hypothetical protein
MRLCACMARGRSIRRLHHRIRRACARPAEFVRSIASPGNRRRLRRCFRTPGARTKCRSRSVSRRIRRLHHRRSVSGGTFGSGRVLRPALLRRCNRVPSPPGIREIEKPIVSRHSCTHGAPPERTECPPRHRWTARIVPRAVPSGGPRALRSRIVCDASPPGSGSPVPAFTGRQKSARRGKTKTPPERWLGRGRSKPTDSSALGRVAPMSRASSDGRPWAVHSSTPVCSYMIHAWLT